VVELLTLGGLLTGLAVWGFWAVALVVFGVFIALTENEHWGWASTLFLGVFASQHWHYKIKATLNIAPLAGATKPTT